MRPAAGMGPMPATQRLPCQATREASAARRISMLDIVMLALGLGFFAAAVGYTYACERL